MNVSIKIRDLISEDFPILANLLRETYENSYEFAFFKEANIHSRIQELNLSVQIAERNGEILGTVALRDDQWGRRIEWLAVQESQDKLSVEDALIQQAEKDAKSEASVTFVDAKDPQINEWIRRGYTPEDGMCHMVAKLDRLISVPEVSSDVTLRNMESEEEKELVEIINSIFGRERLKIGFVQEWKSEYPPFDEEWVHLAESNNRIVSAVVSRPDKRYNEAFSERRGYLGPAATVSEFRSKHLASALTVRAMNFLFKNGFESVALHTSERNIPSLTLLRKLDFEMRQCRKILRKKLLKKC